jgi:polyphosphate kinase
LFPSGIRWVRTFRVTRGAKDDPWDRLPLGETELDLAPGSIIGMVSAELTARKFAGIVRVEISGDMPKERQSWLAENLRAGPADIIPMNSPLALTDLVKFQPEDCEHLRDPEHRPVDHPRLHRLDAQDTGATSRRFGRETSCSTIPIRISTSSCASSNAPAIRRCWHQRRSIARANGRPLSGPH